MAPPSRLTRPSRTASLSNILIGTIVREKTIVRAPCRAAPSAFRLGCPPMQRREPATEFIGRQVGRYTIVSHLASGGMAELYIARQEAVGGFEKNLVLKMLQGQYAENPRVVRMFLDEARVAAKLNHPSIVHVYDVAEEEGIKYIAMEYIHGETVIDI